MRSIPDVEVTFRFLGVREHPSINGYCPLHQITDQELTSGIHHYYGVDKAPLHGTIDGTITFLAPEEYPCTLWIGREIAIEDGARIVGYAMIRKIFNAILRKEGRDDRCRLSE